MGVDVLLVGPVPTPGTAFAMRNMRADAGIMVSASHNPYQDNGIKIFSRDGFKLSYKVEQEIRNLIQTGEINHIRPTADDIGKAYRIDDALGRYIVFCKNTFPSDLTLEGKKIVIDCANGATYKVAPTIFTELGADVVAIHNEPNGKNINDNCGSLFPKDTMDTVRRTDADIGLAFDGDGDRLIAVDEKGGLMDGDRILGICAKNMKEIGTLRNEVVVITPMANFGLRKALDALDVRYVEASVGDRNVLEMMQREGSVLGGEQSGHIIFLNHQTTGDGIVSALQLLAAIARSGKSASALAGEIVSTPQVLINVNVSHKPPLEEVPALQAAVLKAKKELGDGGRVLVRYSGTELVCRVMVEADSEAAARRIAQSLADAVKKAIG
jgi:phosphoglucosamine mutase